MAPPLQLGIGIGMNLTRTGGQNRVSRIAFLGDSITDGNSGSDGFFGYGYISSARAILNQRFASVPRDDDYASAPDFDWGFSGWTSYNLEDGRDDGGGTIYPLSELAALGTVDRVFILAGVNDIVNAGHDAATTVADIVSLHRAAQAAGLKTFGATVLPVGVAQGATKRDAIAAVRASLPSALAAIGVPCCDLFAALDLDAGGYGTTEMYNGDGLDVHLSIAGATKVGMVLADWLDTRVGANPVTSIPADGAAEWLTTNPYMAGDTGGKARRLGVAYGATYHTYSKITAGGYVWQQFATAGISYDESLVYFGKTHLTSADPFWGKTAIACARIQCDSAGWGSKGVQLNLKCYDAGYTNLANSYDGKSSSTWREWQSGPCDPFDGLLLTTPVTIPDNTKYTQARLSWFGDGVIRVTQLGVFLQ